MRAPAASAAVRSDNAREPAIVSLQGNEQAVAVRFGSWLCKNALAGACQLVTSTTWPCVVIFRRLVALLSGSASDEDCSRPGRFCNGRRTHVGGDYAFIAAMSGWTPMMFMTRVRLYASTCRAISVATFGRRFIRKCVAPIRILSVPKGCSTVSRRWRIA